MFKHYSFRTDSRAGEAVRMKAQLSRPSWPVGHHGGSPGNSQHILWPERSLSGPTGQGFPGMPELQGMVLC